MKLRRGRDQRGTVLLFVTTFMVGLLAMAGLATDISYLVTAKKELRRSMDAASLAGAGKLGFDDTVFPTVRQFSQDFAGLNPFRQPGGGTISLNLNTGNAANGDIVLGIWNGVTRTFTPSLDGTIVNAVLCRVSTTIPTSFLRVLGLTSLPVDAWAIAVSDPPATVPPTGCVLPMGVTSCSYVAPPGSPSGFNSLGCGQPITFISSSGAAPGTAGGTNTGVWINLAGAGAPSTPSLVSAINAAASGTCSGTSLTVGDPVGVNNGMAQPVFDALETAFVSQYNQSGILTVYGPNQTVTYQGKGWEVYVALISDQPLPNPPSQCPPRPISGSDWRVVGWTRFVMTQVIRNQQAGQPRCVVDNPNDWNSLPLCSDPTLHPSLRALFGFFDCTSFDVVNPIVEPGPRAALADRVRLVQ
jgi:Flp pilus assembly protein TadG